MLNTKYDVVFKSFRGSQATAPIAVTINIISMKGRQRCFHFWFECFDNHILAYTIVIYYCLCVSNSRLFLTSFIDEETPQEMKNNKPLSFSRCSAS